MASVLGCRKTKGERELERESEEKERRGNGLVCVWVGPIYRLNRWLRLKEERKEKEKRNQRSRLKTEILELS